MSSNLLKRVFSSFVIFLIFLLCFVESYSGNHIFFYLLISVIISISSFELFQMSDSNILVFPIAFFMIAIPNASLIYIYSNKGFNFIFWLIISIWSVDIFAYFIGRLYGGPKICPAISPGKTWSGLIGSIIGSVTTSVIFSLCSGIFNVLNSILLGIIIAVLGQAGDFLESFVKRVFKVKDSGVLIPGHGGVLDRFDGFILTAPFFACFAEYFS